MNKLFRLRPRVVLLKDFFVFDTETGFKSTKNGRNPKGIQWHLNGRPESFQFGVVYGYNYNRVIYTIKEFHEEFQKPMYKGKLIFGHNIIYDLNTLYGNIYKVDPTAIFKGKFICATNGNCRFADSMNIFGHVPLAKIGEMLGIEKPDLGNKSMYSKNGIGPKEINRCHQDCVITWEGLISIFQGAGDIKITGPSLAMTYFRRFHQPYDIQYNDNTIYFFDSYYGGRTEAFKIGPTNATVTDGNSMYAYIMKNSVFPNPRYLKSETNVNVKYFITKILPDYEGLIYCTVNHANTKYGFLPYKTSDEKGKRKLLFPVGRFKGCWNLPEIRFALEHGAIKIESIERIVYSTRIPTIFESYVDELYLKKITSKNPMEISRVKHLLTDLYGKFAQKHDEDSIYIEDIDSQMEFIRQKQREGLYVKLSMFSSERNDAMLTTKAIKTRRPKHSIPSFASYITTNARIYLLKQLLAMDSRGVVYCDTDSIFFENAVGVESETQLGGWKIEPKIVTEVRGLKNYMYYETEGKKAFVLTDRIKGVPKKAVKGIDNIYRYQTLMGTKEALRRGLEPGVLTDRTKTITGKYDKRIVLENGETKPIEIYV